MADRLSRIRSILIVIFCTIGSRVLGMARDMLQAYVLPSALFDAFDVAFTFPNLFRRLFGEGALNAAFIPVLKEEMEHGDTASTHRLINGTATLLFLVLSAIVAVSYVVAIALNLFAPQYKASGELFKMLYIMLPYIILICMTALLAGTLNAYGIFGIPESGAILLNVCEILALLYIVPTWMGVKGLACAVVVAGMLQLGMMVVALRYKGVWVRPCFDFRQSQIAKTISLMAPVMLGLGVMQINVMCDRLIAYVFIPGDGANKVLYIGNRLMQLPLGVFGIAVATVVFPELAACAARRDNAGFIETFQHGLRLVLFTCVPAGVGLMVLGRPTIELLFQRGEFVAADTLRAVWVLGMYSVGLWAFSSVHVVTRAFYSQQDTKTPVKCASAMVGLNVALNVILVLTPLRESGLALATSICSALNFLILGGILRRRIGHIGARSILASVTKTAIATGAMAATCLIVLAVLPHSASLKVRLVRVAAPMAAGTVVFLVAAVVLKAEELRDLGLAVIRRRRGGPK